MGFIIAIHILVCVLLVITILMQAGRGGGLTESLSSAESVFGTQTNAFMVRFSSILAIIFFSTSLILAITASKKDKSLMSDSKMLPKAEQAAAAKQPAVVVSQPTAVTDVVKSEAKATVADKAPAAVVPAAKP